MTRLLSSGFGPPGMSGLLATRSIWVHVEVLLLVVDDARWGSGPLGRERLYTTVR